MIILNSKQDKLSAPMQTEKHYFSYSDQFLKNKKRNKETEEIMGWFPLVFCMPISIGLNHFVIV